ncbi:MAG: serine/threonine-protein kinase [Fuerstiella sp.]
MHPDQIGPYRITRKIGSGGMGNVYHGVHEDTQQEVAVKVLPASMTRESGFVRRFSREIEAMRQLNNPHIVQLFEDGQSDDGSYFYSMEFVDGETLTSLISRKRKLPWDEVIDLSSQIATALKAAHDAGIVHRDLKPSNLMIGTSGNLKLMDFGVADIFAGTRLTRPGGVVGTAEYMSPEQARGKRATKKSDLYSLGAVMYAMLAGRPPFSGKQASEIMHKHQVAQFDRPSHYAPATPRLLEELVCQLLEKKPDDRFPDALVVQRQLSNIKGRVQFEKRTDEQTRVINDEQTSGGQTIPGTEVDERGPATLVRDVMRQQISDSQRKSPIAAFFDNTYVLITMLAAMIFLGFYLSQRTEKSPEEKLVEAKQLLEGKPGIAWVRARNELLQPLIDSDQMAEQRLEIRELIQRVEDFEFCRSLKVKGTGGAAQSETHRLLQRAFQTHSSGDASQATIQLKAIAELLKGNLQQSYLNTFVQQTLESWNNVAVDEDRQNYFRAVFNEIKEQMANGQNDVAKLRLDALITLYQNDLSVEQQLVEAKQLQQEFIKPPAK